VGDVEDAIDQFESDLDDVQDEDTDLPSGVESALRSAASGLQGAIDDLPSDETLDQAGDAVSSAQSALASAWSDLLDALDCSSSSS
jgi:hypothetical protein